MDYVNVMNNKAAKVTMPMLSSVSEVYGISFISFLFLKLCFEFITLERTVFFKHECGKKF